MSERKLPLIGRDHAVVNTLTRGLYFAARAGLPIGKQGGGKRVTHETTAPTPTSDGRGFRFDVRIFGEDGEPTGHIARVAVTLERVEQRADYENDLAIREAAGK
jgi:hypothetical protein